jgi:hypothetical protein
MKKLLSTIAVLGLMSSAQALAAGSDESWEMTTRMDMPGMEMPGVTQTVCLPKGAAYQPTKEQQKKNCEITDLKVSGNKTSWKMHCSGKDAMEGSGEVTRSADKMDGTIKMAMMNMQMTQIISGKRVGTCQAK